MVRRNIKCGNNVVSKAGWMCLWEGMVVVWVQCCPCRWCSVPTARGASRAWARSSGMNATSSLTLARNLLLVHSVPYAVTAKVTCTVTFATTMLSLTSRRLPLKTIPVWLYLAVLASHLWNVILHQTMNIYVELYFISQVEEINCLNQVWTIVIPFC